MGSCTLGVSCLITAALYVTDVATDIWITVLFYQAGHMTAFYVSVSFLIVAYIAQIICACCACHHCDVACLSIFFLAPLPPLFR